MGGIEKIKLNGDYSNPRATPGVIDREKPINVQSASGREAGRNRRQLTNPHSYALNKMAHLNRRMPRNQNSC